MMHIHYIKQCIRHFVKAKHWRGFGIHSPYVYHLQRHIISTDKLSDRELRQRVRKYRKELLRNKSRIALNDLGTGNAKDGIVSKIVKRAAVSEKSGMLLSRLAADYKPDMVLELGTSLGVGTAYLALGSGVGVEVLTIEGSPECSKVAQSTLAKHGIQNVQLLTGGFDEVLPQLLDSMKGRRVMVYLDGNHTYEATMRYFQMLKGVSEQNMMIVLDDIHLHLGMSQAWKEICQMTDVTTTIDLMRMGIVVFRSGAQKEQYVLRW
ncbi:MAG: class I SAM-dependent methyltransferase [Bacteroidales bacterium]|nr:class I SAM-dependent methyltransferase [Bacteroidales bacterium]